MTSDRAERVNRIVTEYWQALDAGKPVEWRQLLVDHADLADELQEIFQGYDQLEHLAEPLRSPTTPTLSGQPVSPRLPSGQIIGDYELVEEIARGGMGVVYKARQRRLNRFVALKLVLAGSTATAEEIQRFRNEAEAVAQLAHPHIVPIFEIGQHEHQHYFSMRLIEGGNLMQVIPPTEEERGDKKYMLWAAGIMAKIARAIHYAHQHGILHRDLKPSNILLEGMKDGGEGMRKEQPAGWALVPYVTDFGLAKRMESDTHLTQTGAMIGTPSYMAPEQAKGKKVGPAADVYGIGAVFYHLLTGKKPFEADSPMATLLKVQSSEADRPSKHNRRLPRDLEIICLKCLEKDPRNRFESAYELAEDLERWSAGEPIRARPLSSLERTHRFIVRHPTLMMVLYVLLILLVSLGWNGYFWNELRKRDDELQRTQDALIKLRQKR